MREDKRLVKDALNKPKSNLGAYERANRECPAQKFPQLMHSPRPAQQPDEDITDQCFRV